MRREHLHNTVTASGDAETRRLVNRLARRNPRVKIALVGCQAQLQARQLARLPNVRWVIGNGRKMELHAIVAQTGVTAAPIIHAEPIPRGSFTLAHEAKDRYHTRANLKIQDGCDFYCFFCVIPYARGAPRSREFDDLLREARDLAVRSVKELILTGVNIGTYRFVDKGFMDVVAALREIGVPLRLRISSIEPTTVPPKLIATMASNTSVCRHLHLPLQSGCDELLDRMNRRYTTADYRQFVDDANTRVKDFNRQLHPRQGSIPTNVGEPTTAGTLGICGRDGTGRQLVIG